MPNKVFVDVENKPFVSKQAQSLFRDTVGQDFFGDMRVGDKGAGSVRIEGTNNRIIINDGTTDRILIGYDEGGF